MHSVLFLVILNNDITPYVINTSIENDNRRLKSIIPELTEFLGILIDFNFDLEELNDTDREDSKKFNDMKSRTICIIVDSSKA